MTSPAGDGRFRHTDINGIEVVSPSQSKDLRSEFDNLKKERDSLIQREAIATQKLGEAMDLKKENNRLGQLNAVLEKELKTFKADFSKSSKSAKDANATVVELERRNEELEELLDQEQVSAGVIKQELDEKREALSAYGKREQENSEQIVAQNQAVEKLKRELKNLRAEFDEVNKENGQLRSQIEAQRSQLEVERKMLADQRCRIDDKDKHSSEVIQKQEQEQYTQDEMQFYDVVMDFDFVSGTSKAATDSDNEDEALDEPEGGAPAPKEPEHDGFPLKYRIPTSSIIPDPDGDEGQTPINPFTREGIAVPVIGACTKGKTWLLSSLTGTHLRSSTSVCTRGLSIRYTKVEERSLALLDTAGTGAPVRADQEKDIFFREMAEQLLREAAISAGGNLFIFVVGDITAPEQYELRRLKEGLQAVSSDFRIIVVHNLRDECTWSGMKEKFDRLKDHTLRGSKEVVQDVLNSEDRRTGQEGLPVDWDAKDEKAMWLQNKDAQVQHFLIGRAGTDADRRNKANFINIQRILLAGIKKHSCDNMIEKVLLSLSKSAKIFYEPEAAFVLSEKEKLKYFMTLPSKKEGLFLGNTLEEAKENAPSNYDPEQVFYCQSYVKPIPKWLKEQQDHEEKIKQGKKATKLIDPNPNKLPNTCTFKRAQLGRAGNYHVFKSRAGGAGAGGERLVKAYQTPQDITMYIDFPGAKKEPEVEWKEEADGLLVLTFTANRPNPISEGTGAAPLNQSVAEAFKADCGKVDQHIELRNMDTNDEKWNWEWIDNVFVLTIPKKSNRKRTLRRISERNDQQQEQPPPASAPSEPQMATVPNAPPPPPTEPAEAPVKEQPDVIECESDDDGEAEVDPTKDNKK